MSYSPTSPRKTLDVAPVRSGTSRPPPPRRRSETRVTRQSSVVFRHDDGSCDSSLSDELDWGMEAMDLRPSGHRSVARAAEISGPVRSSSDVVGEGMPRHWREVESLFTAPANAEERPKDRAPVQDEGTSLSRESEQAYWALRKLRSLDENPPPGYDRDSDGSSNGSSSSLWDKMESNHSANRSTRTECSPLKLCARRWAKATVGCAALAALSVAVIHLFAADPQAFGMVHRNFPEGEGNGKEAVAIPWFPRADQDEDSEEETASPQEKNRWSKEDEMQDHEERVRLQVAECKRRNYEAVACKSMLQDARHYDTNYYYFSEEDGRTAPQDGQYQRLLRGVGLDQDGDEESYSFQYRRYLQGIDDEHRGDEESSRGLRMVTALVEELEREFERQRAGMRPLS